MKSFHPMMFVLAFVAVPYATPWIRPALGQCEVAKLLADDGTELDGFGTAAAIWCDTIVVGARDDWTGSAYIFIQDGSTWVQEAKLMASDGAPGDAFGCSVAIQSDAAAWVFVGARYDDHNGPNCGSVYAFRRENTGWVEYAKLLAPDGAGHDLFGTSVAVSGYTAMVGTPNDDDYAEDTGAVYVYRFDGLNWAEEQKLRASDAAWHDLFGCYVAISGNTAIVGAYCDDNGPNSGAAYVFRHDGLKWVEQAKLLPADGQLYDWFGVGVAVSGDVALIGARGVNDVARDAGAAYVFRFDGARWVQEAKLLASDGAEYDRFGFPVALAGEVAVIGAPGDDEWGYTSVGSAYVFRFDGSQWIEEAKLLTTDGDAEDRFGADVAVFRETAVVGAWWDDDNGYNAGAAYVFELDTPHCAGDLDRDCDTDDADLSILVGGFGIDDAGDLDRDGDTDQSDLGILLSDWGCGVRP